MKQYSLCVANEISSREGNRTIFTSVGKVFENKTKEGRSVLSVKLGATVILGPRTEVVCFLDDGKQSVSMSEPEEESIDDEVPF